ASLIGATLRALTLPSRNANLPTSRATAASGRKSDGSGPRGKSRHRHRGRARHRARGRARGGARRRQGGGQRARRRGRRRGRVECAGAGGGGRDQARWRAGGCEFRQRRRTGAGRQHRENRGRHVRPRRRRRQRRRHPARPHLPSHERGRLGSGAQGSSVRHFLRLARGGDALPRAGVGRLRAFHFDLGPGRQLRPGQLRRRQARHRRAVEIDCARHAALQRALQLRLAVRLEPHDRHASDRDRGREAPRCALATHDAGEDRADGDLSAQRRGEGRDRADFRRAHERDHADGPVAPGPLGATQRRLDPGNDHRARHAGAQGLVLSAAALAGSVQLGPELMTGILAFGAYIPRLRLARRAIAEANAWFNPALNAQAKGERAICNWDEDAVTMAVEAARDALAERDRGAIGALQFASTSFPFADRLNAGIVAEALNLNKAVAALDVAASQRAGTSALIAALRGGTGETLVVAADKRRTRSASPLEMSVGDAAAAVLVGEGEPAARLLACASHTADFVDHYRGEDTAFDYQWEERWIRDAGYLKIVPPAIAQCLKAANVEPGAVSHFCMPATLPRVAASVAKAAGVGDKAVRDNLHAVCGEAGAAHPLIMLVAALEQAKPGERIPVGGFGQGADALLFEATPAIANQPARRGVRGHLARRKEETSYSKYLAFNELVEVERGMRAEADKLTPLSSLWRNRDILTGFLAGPPSTPPTLPF